MAALPLDELETATRRHFMPVVTNQIFKVSPVLHRIFKPAKEGSWGLALPSFDGRSIAEPLEYAEVTGTYGAYKKSTTWTLGTTDVLSIANYPWRMYYVGLKIHNIEVEQNKGRERVFDLAAIKLQNAVKILRKSLITDFYGTQDDTDADEKMIGFGAVADTTKTIGGIDQPSYTWWRGYLNHAESGRDLSWLLLNKAFYETKKYGAGDRATLIVASEGVMQDYENTLTKITTTGGGALASLPLVQLMASTKDGPRKIEGGFETFSFKRIPMVADPYCTANTLFFINENHVHWRVLKNFDATGWTQQRVNGKDWVQNVIYGYGALTFSSLRKHSMIDNLNEQ